MAPRRTQCLKAAASPAPLPPPAPATNDDDEPRSTRLRSRTRQPLAHSDLSNISILRALEGANINTRIRVSWKHFPDPTVYETNGTIIQKTPKGYTVHYDDPNVGTQHLPPTNSDVLIFEAAIVGTALLDRPLVQHNRSPRHDCPTIFADGGARPSSGGPAASAIYLQKPAPQGTAVVEEHGRFYPAATNNVAEALALLAALCLAARLIRTGYPHVNIVLDSELIYCLTLGTRKAKDATLKDMHLQIAERFAPIVGQISLCHMLRDFGNPADRICTTCILTQQNVGDQTLFSTTAPAPKKTPPTIAPQQVHHRTLAPEINSLEEFIALRKFKAKSRAPANAAPLFAQISHHQLMQFHLAEDDASRQQHLLRFLALPSLYLPAAVSTNRIVRHLSAATPFVFEASEGRHLREKTSDNRVSEAVQRLVMDRKLRSANKLLQNVADHNDIPHEEKISRLQSKFVDGSFACSIQLANIPHITSNEVVHTLGRMSKQAATAIDGWSSTLLTQIIHHQPSCADALAEMLTYILTQPLNGLVRDCLLTGRLVAVPKGESDVRPIVVSSTLLNLMGNIAVQRDSKAPCEAQYAIGVKQGCQRIIHKLRRARESGKTIVKFDLKNAFGMLKRQNVQEFVKSSDPTLQQFFRLTYGSKTALCIYGPSGNSIVQFGQGVKQGDATSSYLFCHTVDAVLRNISKRCDIPLHEIFAYMDDLTFAVPLSAVNGLTTVVVEEFAKVGMEVNLDKSAALTSDASVVALPRVSPNQFFKLLGIDFGLNPSAWVEDIWLKQQKYFDLVRHANLHPHIAFILLRICASPRIVYHVQVLQPQETDTLTTNFERRLREEFSTIIDPSGNTIIDDAAFYNRFGIGAPALNKLRHELYEATKLMSLNNVKDTPQLALTEQTPHSQHAANQDDAQWLFYNSSLFALSPAQFSTALAVRLNIQPPHLSLTGKRCSCGQLLDFDHVLSCDLSTGLTHATRHNKVRDCIITIARRFAITASAEPNIYSYADGRRHRPDILFHVGVKGITTDITIVNCQTQPGQAAEAADKQKEKLHTTATSTLGHLFIPCAFEAHGHFGNGFVKLARQLADFIIPVLRADFFKDLIHAVSSTMAANRADAIHSAVQRTRWL